MKLTDALWIFLAIKVFKTLTREPEQRTTLERNLWKLLQLAGRNPDRVAKAIPYLGCGWLGFQTFKNLGWNPWAGALTGAVALELARSYPPVNIGAASVLASLGVKFFQTEAGITHTSQIFVIPWAGLGGGGSPGSSPQQEKQEFKNPYSYL